MDTRNRFPLVSVITPTTEDREVHFSNLSEYIKRQSYSAIEHIVIDGNGSIAAKRNAACSMANGDIIIHMDSDDWCAFDWVERIVKHMLHTGCDTTGLSNAYFYKPHSNLWLYKWNGNMVYTIGGTLAYKRSIWQDNPFKETATGVGEDTLFMRKAGRVVPHNYVDGFVAMIHDSNTTSHNGVLTNPRFTEVDPGVMNTILGCDYSKYPIK